MLKVKLNTFKKNDLHLVLELMSLLLLFEPQGQRLVHENRKLLILIYSIDKFPQEVRL